MSAPYANLRRGLIGAWCPSIKAGPPSVPSHTFLPDLGNRTNTATYSTGFGNQPALFPASGSGIAWKQRCDSGRGEHFTVAAGNLPSVGVNYSAACWVNVTSATQNFPDFGFMSHGPTSNQLTGWVLLGDRGTSNLLFYINGGNRVSVSGAIIRDLWQHYGCTSDGTTVRLYVNGVPRASAAYSTGGSTDGNPLKIGSYFFNNGASGIADAFFDDVRYYSRALAPSEMMLLASRRGIGLLPTRHRRANVLGSQFWLRDAGAWKKAQGWIKVNGVWTKATPKINASGTWK